MVSWKQIVRKCFIALYWWACVALWAAYLYYSNFGRGGSSAGINGVLKLISHLLPDTGDPVLYLLIGLVLVVIGIILIPGIIAVWLFVLVGILVLGLLTIFIAALVSLGRVSTTGAIIAGISAAIAVDLLIRLLAKPLGRILPPVGDVLFGGLLDWWLYPLLLRLKEKRIMNHAERTKVMLDQTIGRLHDESPEIADLSLSIGYGTWIDQVAERFRDRQRQKSVAEKIKLLEQIKRFYAEWRAALDAQDEVQRAKSAYAEKDEEAELRKLEREERRMVLKQRMDDLRTKSAKEKPPPQPQKTKEQRIDEEFRKVETLADVQRKKQAVQAQYTKGSPEYEYAESIADHVEGLIKDGKW